VVLCGFSFFYFGYDDTGSNLMLPLHCQFMLKSASLSKDVDQIQKAIDMVKGLSSENFLQNEQDMKQRVFYHRPFGVHWSGNYVEEGGYPRPFNFFKIPEKIG